ncbi:MULTISPECIES: protein kinase family protein [Sporosarcina]|uniref:protein kinase family protein n=1 Tax=Sporosarcina TaxID=1569 RepID=UPI00129ADA8C|nr:MULTISPECIES: protein kinase family protein [Sporosarcina]GKV65751.1 putative serine/threonine-protein kinase YrzF [Sporosarcina sp. NCCP-2331]GLB55875.1 putative serine/threonine-protein kinase YrzF [Sporosarcina sp. NCCP-2378]
MNSYLELANSVIIDKENRLVSCDKSLRLIGTGRSAFVFKVTSTNKAMKVFFPNLAYISIEEAEIYQSLQGIHYFPSIYETGSNYIIMDYIEGYTLFECMTYGVVITADHIKEIDYALSLASAAGLNPSDIHLRNIFITSDGNIKLIDVARYRQMKKCRQWSNLKKAHRQFYRKRFFLKKVPASFLNILASLYKRGLIPNYRL